MENILKYAVSFGDSNKFAVPFAGSLDEFLKSDVFKGIKDKVTDYLKKQFPLGGFLPEVTPKVEKCDDPSMPELNENTLSKLLENVKNQVQVMKDTKGLNLNAPFDILG